MNLHKKPLLDSAQQDWKVYRERLHSSKPETNWQTVEYRRFLQSRFFERVEVQQQQFQTWFVALEQSSSKGETQVEQNFNLDFLDIPKEVIINDFVSYPSDETIAEWQGYYEDKKDREYLDWVRQGKEIQKKVFAKTHSLDPFTKQKLRYLIPKLQKGGIKLSQWIDTSYVGGENQYTWLLNRLAKISDQDLYILGRFFEQGIMFLDWNNDYDAITDISILEQAFALIPELQQNKHLQERHYSDKEVYASEIQKLYQFIQEKGEEGVLLIKMIFEKVNSVYAYVRKKHGKNMFHLSALSLIEDREDRKIENLLTLTFDEIDWIIAKSETMRVGFNFYDFLEALPYLRKHQKEVDEIDFSNKQNLYPYKHHPNVSQTLFYALHQDIEVPPEDKESHYVNRHHHPLPLHFRRHALVLQRYIAEMSPETQKLCEFLGVNFMFENLTMNFQDRETNHAFYFANKIIEDLAVFVDNPDLVKFLQVNFVIADSDVLLLLADLVKRNGLECFTFRTEYVRKLTGGRLIDLRNDHVAFFYFALELKYGGWQHNEVSTEELEFYVYLHEKYHLSFFQNSKGEEIEGDYIIRKYLHSEEREDHHGDGHDYERRKYFKSLGKQNLELASWQKNPKLYLQACTMGLLTPERENNFFKPGAIRRVLELDEPQSFLNIIDPQSIYLFEKYPELDAYLYAYEGDIRELLRYYQYYGENQTPASLEIMHQLYPEGWAGLCQPEIERYFKKVDHNGNPPGVKKQHLAFLHSFFRDNPEFFYNFLNRELRRYVEGKRWGSSSDSIIFVIQNNLADFVDWSLYRQALLKNLIPLYRDQFVEKIVEEFKLLNGVNGENWVAFFRVFESRQEHWNQETKQKLEIIFNRRNQKFLRHKIKKVFQKILHQGIENLDEKEKEYLSYLEKHQSHELHYLNLLTEGDLYLENLFEGNLVYHYIDELEKCFQGSLKTQLRHKPDAENILVNPLNAPEGKLLINELTDILNEYYQIRSRNFLNYNPRYDWEKDEPGNSLPELSHKRRNYIEELRVLQRRLITIEQNPAQRQLVNLSNFKKEIQELERLIFLFEFVNTGHSVCHSKLETSSFFKETNPTTQTAMAGMSLMLASGALSHPQIQVPLEKIPLQLTSLNSQYNPAIIDRYHQVLCTNIERIAPQVERLFLQARQALPGLMPIGGKIHVSQAVDPKMVNFLMDIFAFGQTPFKLIHADTSLLLPPVPTDFELSIYIKILELLGAVNLGKHDLQTCMPGRLSEENAPLVGASILLGTDKNVHYKPEAVSTTCNYATDARIMAYDAGVRQHGLPFDLPQMYGRTDVLGRHSLNDPALHRIVHTLIAHRQAGGVFAEHGERFAQGLSNILEKHHLAGALNQSAWVYDHANKGDDTRANHYDMLSAFTNAWHESNLRPDRGVITDLHYLIRQSYREMQTTSRQIYTPNHPEYQKNLSF